MPNVLNGNCVRQKDKERKKSPFILKLLPWAHSVSFIACAVYVITCYLHSYRVVVVLSACISWTVSMIAWIGFRKVV